MCFFFNEIYNLKLTHSAKYVIKTSFDVTTKPDIETTLVIGCIWKFPGRLFASRRFHDVVTTSFTSRCRHNVSTTFREVKKTSEKLSYTTKYPSSFDVGFRRATSCRVGKEHRYYEKSLRYAFYSRYQPHFDWIAASLCSESYKQI